MCDETNNTVVENLVNPFDDPLQRTKYLIKYIRLRKQRAEGEIAKRNALKKQKKDAQATLYNARESMRACEVESNRCKQRLEELTQSKHELLITLKSIINRETERKRRREALEENRRMAAEQQATILAQAAAEQQQYFQQAALETFLLSNQFKNPNLLNSLGMGNRIGYSNIAQLFNTMQQQQLINNSSTNRASTFASPTNTQLQQRYNTPFQSTTPTIEQQQQQSSRQQQQLQAQQAAAAVLQSQQQQTTQQQVALTALIRQQLLAATMGQQSQQAESSVLPSTLMHSSVIPSPVAAALHLQQQQQMPNEMVYQTLLATIKAMNPQH